MLKPVDHSAGGGPASAEEFFCLVRENAVGPFGLIDLAAELRTSRITPDTMVRRGNKDKWLALRELPEFAAIEDMPIETIARHLVEKENAANPASPASGGSFLSGATPLVVCLAVVAGILAVATLFQKSPAAAPGGAAPAPAPAQEPWVTTHDENFSVDCPIPMERVDNSNTAHSTCSYEANYGRVHFVVQIYELPGAIPQSEYDFLIDSARNKIVGGGTVTSQRFFSTSDTHGLDSAFVVKDGRSGELRILAGRGKLAIASVLGPKGDFKSTDMDRFLNSFDVR